MKKLLLIPILLLLACIAFAENYPFAIIVFPATISESIEAGPSTACDISNALGKAINANPSLCAMTFNPNNNYIKYMVEEGQLEESDLDLPVDEGNCERISESMDADGYAVLDVKSFAKDDIKCVADLVCEVKIFKNGSEEPIFVKEFKGKYNLWGGYVKKSTDARCFEKCLKSLTGKMTVEMAKLDGFQYKELKVVEPYVFEEDEE